MLAGRSKPLSHRVQFLLNAVVSVVTVAAEFLLYWALVSWFGVYHVWASGVVGVVGLFINFALSRFFVFSDTQGHWGGQLLRYALATGLGIGAGMGVLYLLVDVGGLEYRVGWVISNLSVFTLWTYPTNRFLVFPRRAAA